MARQARTRKTEELSEKGNGVEVKVRRRKKTGHDAVRMEQGLLTELLGAAAPAPKPQPVPEPEPEAAAEPEPVPAPEPEPEAAAAPEAVPACEPEPQVAAESEPVPAPEPEPEIIVESESAAAAEPEPEAEDSHEEDDSDGTAEEDQAEGRILSSNPYGWGLGTTPPGRVRFLRFFTWSTLPGHLVSLRDGSGKFPVPGYFTAIQATRSAGPIIAALRSEALKKEQPLNVQTLFVPVVYPDVVPFRYWQHCTNPFEHTLVTMHYLHKKIAEQQAREQFGADLKDGLDLRNLSSLLADGGKAVQDFFSKPASRRCRGIVWRGKAGTLLGRNFPQPGRLVSFAVLRPEWIVDAQPVADAPDLVDSARKKPGACLERVRRLLVMDEKSLAKASRSGARPKRVRVKADGAEAAKKA